MRSRQAAIVALAALVGCAHAHGGRSARAPGTASPPRAISRAVHAAARATLPPHVDDAQLAVRVKAALATQVGLDAFRVSVHADRGIVTIRGHAPSAGVARGEVGTALQVPGVRRVVDRITVSP